MNVIHIHVTMASVSIWRLPLHAFVMMAMREKFAMLVCVKDQPGMIVFYREIIHLLKQLLSC